MKIPNNPSGAQALLSKEFHTSAPWIIQGGTVDLEGAYHKDQRTRPLLLEPPQGVSSLNDLQTNVQ